MRTLGNLLVHHTPFLVLALGVAPATAAPAAAQPAPSVQAPVQARPGGPETEAPRTDRTIDVATGTRLVLNNQAGEVVVRAWDRDQVRVQASHGPREQVEAQVAEQVLRVRARGTRGTRGLVDYRLTVPRWMALDLSGTYLEADVEGTSAEVTVETVGGSIRLVGGSGPVSLRSVEGTVTVENTAGKIGVSTVNDGIRLVAVSGDVTAERINGDVELRDLKAALLDVSTVNGDVTWTGTTADRGTSRIATHSGDIRVSVGQAANATVFMRTFGGDFSADFPITLPEGMADREGHKRFNFTLGGGSARLELRSFNGDIHMARGPLGVAPVAPVPPAAPVAKPPKPPGDGDPLPGWAEPGDWDAMTEEVRAAMAEAHRAADAAMQDRQQALRALELDHAPLDEMRRALDEAPAAMQRRRR